MASHSSPWSGARREWVKAAHGGLAQWRSLFSENNLLTYASAIAFQLLIAAAAAAFLGVSLRICVAATLCWCVIALIVYAGPAKRQPWQWVSAGSVWIILAWLAVSLLYAAWVGQVVNLRSVEGALAVVVLTTGYLYASSLAFLIGAQLDQLIRQGGVRLALSGDAGD